MTNRMEITARRVAQELLALREATPAPVSAGEPAQLDYPRLQDQMRWFEGLLKVYRAVANAAADQITVDRESASDAGDDDELVPVLRRAHRLLLEHPVAAKRAYTALVQQGREFARTSEGAALREQLATSAKVRRGALLWRSLTMGMLDADDHGELPSTFLDNLLRAVDRPDLEQLLGKLQQR